MTASTSPALLQLSGVPGPPRARRRLARGDLRERVDDMRQTEVAGPGAATASLLRLLGDVILLVKDLVLDPRVPVRAKAVPAGIAIAFVLGPVRLAPESVPVLRRVDDALVMCWSVRRLLRTAGYERIYEAWRGSATGLAVVLNAAGVE